MSQDQGSDMLQRAMIESDLEDLMYSDLNSTGYLSPTEVNMKNLMEDYPEIFEAVSNLINTEQSGKLLLSNK